MRVLIVNIKVKADKIAEFQDATLGDAAESAKEPGWRASIYSRTKAISTRSSRSSRSIDDAAQEKHRATPHYARWKELAEPMMAEPRSRAMYRLLEVD